MYAIIATGGKQYKVQEGDVIKVEKLGVEAGSEVTFDQVLLVGDKDVKVGTPTVAGSYNVSIYGVDKFGNYSNAYSGTIEIAEA